MGGILGAEVVLLAPYRADDPRPAVHRILGTINFDVPFLGIHPGIVKAGLASLFRGEDPPPELRPAPGSGPGSSTLLNVPSHDSKSPAQASTAASSDAVSYFPSQSSSAGTPSTAASLNTLSPHRSPLATPVNDPNFNPRYDNDVVRPMRKGWDRTIHFVGKHYGGLTKAARAAVASHVEFSSTMADYRGLRARYRRLRALEDVPDASAGGAGTAHRTPRRVRFANYYTASTGRPKSRSRSRSPGVGALNGASDEAELVAALKAMDTSVVSLASDASPSTPRSASPRISLETPAGDQLPVDAESPSSASPATDGADPPDMTPTSPRPIADETTPTTEGPPPARRSSLERSLNLPPLPPKPKEPPAFDARAWPDKDACKLARDMHTRAMRAHVQAVKDRDKAAAERAKLVARKEKERQKELDAALKRERKAGAQREKGEAVQAAQRAKAAPAAAGGDATPAASANGTAERGATGGENAAGAASTAEASKMPKPPKQGKFCLLPPKEADGTRDPTWERVLMEGMDEVGAHVSLFAEERPHYVELVNRVGEKIREWVEHDRRVREGRE